VLIGHYAVVGCFDLRIFDISNPINPIPVGFYTTPDRVRRISYDGRNIYAACFGAGMYIFDTSFTGIEENTSSIKHPQLLVMPNPASDKIRILMDKLPWNSRKITICIYDITGKLFKRFDISNAQVNNFNNLEIEIKSWPAGCYIICMKNTKFIKLGKIIVTPRRNK
jgi:hypothetical protein